MLRPLTVPYHPRSEKARDKDLKKTREFRSGAEVQTPGVWSAWILKFALGVGPPPPVANEG
jgi:hypothetical protein